MKSFKQSAWSSYRWFLDLIIPPRCGVCAALGCWLCERCAQQIPLFDGPLCARCGRPWQGNGLCPVCKVTPLKVAPIRATFLFQGAVRDIMHALKYRGAREVVKPLAKSMVTAWRRQHMQSDILIPVPLYPSREIKRGYNQAALLARALSRELNLPLAVQALSRMRNTASQTQLGRQARQENVQGAFRYTLEHSLAKKHVTLIDDVATTGATLDACAEVLLAHGVRSVNAFTLARAP